MSTEIQKNAQSLSTDDVLIGNETDAKLAQILKTDLAQKFLAFAMQAQKPTDPSLVIPWQDPAGTGAIGWLVLDKTINQVSGGGIFMHANASQQEVADIAANMSSKFTVCEPQIGGAKAGIKFDHRDPRAKEVLRRFIQDMQVFLRSCWVTAGDLNTDDAFIESVIQDLGLKTCQAALGQKISEKMQVPDRSMQLASIIKKPACAYFPLIEGAVGYGVAASIEKAVQLSEFAGTPNVLIQGFGAVGSSLAHYLTTKKIANVVAISDKDGFIVNMDGIDVDQLLRKRLQLRDTDPVAAKNFFASFSKDNYKKMGCTAVERDITQSGEDYLIAMMQQCQKDDKNGTGVHVVSLCAGRYAMTPTVVSEGLLNGLWSKQKELRLVVCGANNVFGKFDEKQQKFVEDKAMSLSRKLAKQGVAVVCDWVANSGTAQLFHRSLSLDLDLSQSDQKLASVILEACAEPIRIFIQEAYDQVQQQLAYLDYGCKVLAEERIKNPKLMQPVNKSDANPGRSPYVLPPLPASQQLVVEERMRLCTELMAEVVGEEELLALFEMCANPVAYDGFEPSGRMHIAQCILKSIIVNRMQRCGFTFLFWVADWFAMLNNKMGGDMDKIQTLGHYFVEIWRASGMNMDRVRFLWASEEISARHDEYWQGVMRMTQTYTIDQMRRCATIMGRKEGDDLKVSQLMYPAMQIMDMKHLGVDVAQLGLDQRKVNIKAREFAATAAGKKMRYKKPIILSHKMIPGLKQGQEKASKSGSPDDAIFMEDSAEDVKRKIRAAFCPPNQIDGNPVLAYVRDIVFLKEADDQNLPLVVNGSEYHTWQAFSDAFEDGTLHPKDVKEFLTEKLNAYIEPVRQHFANDEKAAKLLARVRDITKKKK